MSNRHILLLESEDRLIHEFEAIVDAVHDGEYVLQDSDSDGWQRTISHDATVDALPSVQVRSPMIGHHRDPIMDARSFLTRGRAGPETASSLEECMMALCAMHISTDAHTMRIRTASPWTPLAIEVETEDGRSRSIDVDRDLAPLLPTVVFCRWGLGADTDRVLQMSMLVRTWSTSRLPNAMTALRTIDAMRRDEPFGNGNVPSTKPEHDH